MRGFGIQSASLDTDAWLGCSTVTPDVSLLRVSVSELVDDSRCHVVDVPSSFFLVDSPESTPPAWSILDVSSLFPSGHAGLRLILVERVASPGAALLSLSLSSLQLCTQFSLRIRFG